MEKAHNYVYKITNTLNNMYYIGKHSTDDLNDGYMGSGYMLECAINYYGIDAFKKEILFDFLEKKYPGRVKWCNQNNKATKGYDFEITGFENKETEYFIACKGAKDNRKIFFLSEEEWNACLSNSLNYQVYLVRDVANAPKIVLIDNLIGWITCGKVRPCAEKNEKVKAGHVMLTLV